MFSVATVGIQCTGDFLWNDRRLLVGPGPEGIRALHLPFPASTSTLQSLALPLEPQLSQTEWTGGPYCERDIVA